MQIPSNTSIQLTSKHFSDKLENNIIQLTRAIAIEHQVPVDPDAKQITRDLIQNKLNQLLSQQEREGLKKVWNDTVKIINGQKITEQDINIYARYVYEALKTGGFDNV